MLTNIHDVVSYGIIIGHSEFELKKSKLNTHK